MQKITPFLWFDGQAVEASRFYASQFQDSKIKGQAKVDEVPAGPVSTVMTVAFQLCDREMVALNGGPMFKFTEAISFFVMCESPQQMDVLWKSLGNGGSVLMPLQKYPFAEYYGWLKDQWGVSWQLILSKEKQKMSPCLLFVGSRFGQAEEAMNLYVSLFPDSGIKEINRYANGEPAEGKVAHAKFQLAGEQFVAMESNGPHQFDFNEAFSFVVNCETQQEVDFYWEKLSVGGKTSRCGWLKDKFGVSWQVVPTSLGTMMQDKDPAKSKRVMSALLKMDKLDIAVLKRAYDAD